MPEAQQQEILERLEAAVAEWNTQVCAAQEGLSDQLARARDKFDSVVHDLRDESSSDETATLRAELAARQEENRALMEEAAALRIEVDRLGQAHAALSEAEKRVAGLERTTRSLREQVAALEAELTRVREHRAPGTAPSGGDDDTLRNHLEQALCDREEAHQEIVVLRAELESLRHKSAAPDEAIHESGVPNHIAAAARDERGHKRRIGDILVTAQVITQEQLDSALAEQGTSRQRRLGEILVSRGFTGEELIGQVLASQLQTPFVQLNDATVERAAARLISERLASHHVCFPIRSAADELTLAMANPLDLIAIEDVELATRLRVRPVVATATEIYEAIARYYY